MTSAQVVETSSNVTTNSASQDYTHPDDHTSPSNEKTFSHSFHRPCYKFSSFSGWVRWDDENTRIDFPNSFGGELPDGIYGENTVIYFCCSTSGRKSAAISMPYKSPFYLIAYGSPRCQRVRYHKASSRISEVHVRDFLGDSCSKS